MRKSYHRQLSLFLFGFLALLLSPQHNYCHGEVSGEEPPIVAEASVSEQGEIRVDVADDKGEEEVVQQEQINAENEVGTAEEEVEPVEVEEKEVEAEVETEVEADTVEAEVEEEVRKTMNIEGTLHFPDMSIFNKTTRITLNHNEYTTYSRPDGSFVIFNVGAGIHQLDIHSTDFMFSVVKIQILEDENLGEEPKPPKCLEYVYPGANKHAITYPLQLTAHAKYQYFEKRSGFSIWPIVKNPMFIMMAFSVGMMVWMPKMMENLDPEEKAMMQKQMEMQKDPSKMLSQLLGGITGAEDEDGPAAVTSGSTGGKKKGRR